MRGKLPFGIRYFNPHGITPADAGKTLVDGKVYPSAQDHPRGCGENFHRFLYADTDSGSPPRMRGKHDKSEEHYCECRITPADAGKTVFSIQHGYTV